MCLAIPLKITEINGNEAVGERSGVRRKIRQKSGNLLTNGGFCCIICVKLFTLHY